MELLHAVPLLAWLVTYTAHMPDEASSAPEQRLVSQGGSLIDWWQAHEALTQQQREAEAIDVLLQQGPPTGEKRRYAQWLLNRPLGELGESQWRALREHGSGRSRLEWVTDGFRQAGFAVEAPWDADDVELLLSILGSAGEVDRSAWPDWLAANALWLLERLATQQPPPSSTEWIGPLVRSPAAEERDWKIQAARWNDWWRGAERAVLRDPAEPLW